MQRGSGAAWAVWPRTNRLLWFDGARLHGVLGGPAANISFGDSAATLRHRFTLMVGLYESECTPGVCRDSCPFISKPNSR